MEKEPQKEPCDTLTNCSSGQRCAGLPIVKVSSKEGAGPAPQRGRSLGAASMQANPSGCKIICFVGVAGVCPQACARHPQQRAQGGPGVVVDGDTSAAGTGAAAAPGCPPAAWGRGSHRSLCKPTRGVCRCGNGAAAATEAQQDPGTSTARDTSQQHNTVLRG